MGLAKKCDHCGNLYELKAMNIRGININGLALVSRNEQNTQTNIRKFLTHARNV